jgi:hypothetical protein
MEITPEKLIEEMRGLRRVVINTCYGGFSLSKRAIDEYKRLAGITDPGFYESDIARDDPYLVSVVKSLGMSANGAHANLKIVEIPSDVDWHIGDYDGNEWVAENHRTWS